jgi:porphobilinogen synthase
MPFPIHRPRRLRSSEQIRSLVRETRLAPTQFVLPLFVCPGEGVRREIGSMPGNYQLSIDQLVLECEEVLSLGIGGVILFGLPETKDEEASGGYCAESYPCIKEGTSEAAGNDRRLQLRVHQPRALRQDC